MYIYEKIKSNLNNISFNIKKNSKTFSKIVQYENKHVSWK